MSISRKTQAPAGIVNASGQPEIVIELDGLVLSMKPPGAPGAEVTDDTEDEAADGK